MASYDLDRFRDFVFSPSFNEVYVVPVETMRKRLPTMKSNSWHFGFRFSQASHCSMKKFLENGKAFRKTPCRLNERGTPGRDLTSKRTARKWKTTNTPYDRPGDCGCDRRLSNCGSSRPGTEEHFVASSPITSRPATKSPFSRPLIRTSCRCCSKGPTGCGKTRFMEYMAWRLKRPLITVSCHDDLTASDLVGRFLVKGGETIWVDGPLARAVRAGGNLLSG